MIKGATHATYKKKTAKRKEKETRKIFLSILSSSPKSPCAAATGSHRLITSSIIRRQCECVCERERDREQFDQSHRLSISALAPSSRQLRGFRHTETQAREMRATGDLSNTEGRGSRSFSLSSSPLLPSSLFARMNEAGSEAKGRERAFACPAHGKEAGFLVHYQLFFLAFLFLALLSSSRSLSLS